MLDELYGAFQTSPHLLQLFRRKLRHCFAVNLHKCYFVEYKTSLNFPSAQEWVHSDWIYIFVWIYPLSISILLLVTHDALQNTLLHTKHDLFITFLAFLFIKTTGEPMKWLKLVQHRLALTVICVLHICASVSTLMLHFTSWYQYI